jgi:hypothetical protein
VDFPDFLANLFQERYTGQTVVHWQDGVPRMVEIVEKRKVDLTPPAPGSILRAASR